MKKQLTRKLLRTVCDTFKCITDGRHKGHWLASFTPGLFSRSFFFRGCVQGTTDAESRRKVAGDNEETIGFNDVIIMMCKMCTDDELRSSGLIQWM